MSEPALLTDELATRVAAILDELLLPADPHAFVRHAHQHGIALVDPTRDKCWIDERVYRDALVRSHQWEERAITAEAALAARDATATVTATEPTDEAEYAIVEVFGHRRHVGRIAEVERFGAKLLRIDIPTEGDFGKGFTSHFYAGGSIFSLTPTTLEMVTRAYRHTEPARLYAPTEDNSDDLAF